MGEVILKRVVEYDYILEESFLSSYNREDKSLKMGYDAVLEIGNAKVFILHEVTEVEKKECEEELAKSDIYKYSRQTVNMLMQRHLKLQKTFKVKLADKQKMYFIGMASLITEHNGNNVNIDHQFGSNYFQEQLVLDFDGYDNLLQLFGTKSFLTILKLLSTPTDVLSFLEYHKKTLSNQDDYRLETILAHTFLYSKELYNSAVEVEEELININILDKHDARLIQTIEANDSQQTQILINRMKEFSSLWSRLLKSTTARHIAKQDPLPKYYMELLTSESLYTRMKIIEEVLAYGQMNSEQKQEGYITYQHSYSQFGRQYMLVMYGTNPDSWLSRNAVKAEYLNLLINLNSQLQDPVMDDLILLGFDMTDIGINGDIDIQMDVYHLKATKMTEIEHYLHNQLLTLKAKMQQEAYTKTAIEDEI